MNCDNIEIKELIMKNEEDCKMMIIFFNDIGKLYKDKDRDRSSIQIVHCDLPLKGLKGFIVFHSPCIDEAYDEAYDGEYNEKYVHLCWKIEEPIKDIIDVEPDKVEELLKDCLVSNWDRCDDPKRLRVGFINYEKSECRYFKVKLIMNLTGEVKELFDKNELKRIKNSGLNIKEE